MRRDNDLKDRRGKNANDKVMSYIITGASVLLIIIISLLLYSQKIKNNVKNETMSLEKMGNIIGENNVNNNETESTSTELGKTVEESKENNTNAVNENNIKNSTNTTNEQTKENTKNNTSNTNNKTKINTTISTNSNNSEKKETKKEISFQKPVEGEIIREFAQNNLVYSNTLEEWITHNGIDIKADKTTVVKSAEAGVVKSIKNDPRYGLTIVIQHDDVYQTIYSNLLTSEFVVEGEKVEKGQAIGTVGNSAVFEVADEPHLHFEILKNSIQIDPSNYLK